MCYFDIFFMSGFPTADFKCDNCLVWILSLDNFFHWLIFHGYLHTYVKLRHWNVYLMSQPGCLGARREQTGSLAVYPVIYFVTCLPSHITCPLSYMFVYFWDCNLITKYLLYLSFLQIPLYTLPESLFNSFILFSFLLNAYMYFYICIYF